MSYPSPFESHPFLPNMLDDMMHAHWIRITKKTPRKIQMISVHISAI